MPELPEVETIRRGLERSLLGRRIASVRVYEPMVIAGSPRKFVKAVSGQILESVQRHGKKLFLTFGPTVVSIHLRMTGRLLIMPSSSPAEKSTHIVVRFAECAFELRFCDVRKFGRWKIENPKFPVSMAPDAWLASKEEVVSALRRRRGMIKHALLSQNVISGLGNIYVDESLHKAKIHPKRRLETISDRKINVFYGGMKRILGKSIEIGGTSFRDYVDTEGSRGGYKNWLVVYGKAGKRCSCGGVIRRTVVAGRGTHFCPNCQK